MRTARLIHVLVGLLLTGVPLAATALEAGQPAPAAVAPRAIDGAAFDWPAQTRGKVVYVDFWASWCVPCRLSFPALNGLQAKYGPQGFVVVGVNQDVALEDAQRFARKVPVTFTLLADPGNALAKAYAVKAMPSGYLVNRAGVVSKVHRGFTTESAVRIEAEIIELLKEAK